MIVKILFEKNFKAKKRGVRSAKAKRGIAYINTFFGSLLLDLVAIKAI
jgi:hypothetical protein